MRAIMREHRLSGPCCRKRRPFSSPRPFQGRYFSQFRVGVARRERRKGEKGAEKGKDRGARSPRFIAVASFFYFLFFFHARRKNMTRREKGEGYITRVWIISLVVSSLNSRSMRVRTEREFYRNFRGVDRVEGKKERRKFGGREGSLYFFFSSSKLNRIPEKDGSPWLCTD